MNINKTLDQLAKRYDNGEFTDSQYLAEITKAVEKEQQAYQETVNKSWQSIP